MRRFGFAAVFALFGFAVVAADDAVTFKLSQPKPEDRVRVTQSDKTKITRTTTIGGKKAVVNEQNSAAWVYVGEIAPKAAKDDQPKLTRTYQKFEVLTNGKAEVGPPLKVPILIEKKGDEFAFSAGEKQLPPAFVKRLEGELSPATQGVTPVEMIPDKPVKPGDTWKIDATKAFQGTGKVTLDADRGTMTGKLVKVYKKDDRQFATLEFTASAPIKSLGPDIALIPKDGSVAELKMTVDACIDGTDPFSRTNSRVSFRVEAAIPGGTIQLTSENQRTESIELVPKK
jgi:hypothetical protein